MSYKIAYRYHIFFNFVYVIIENASGIGSEFASVKIMTDCRVPVPVHFDTETSI